MPTEYQAHCSSCGHKGPVSPWGYQALILEESRIIPLPHPYEARTLREHGYSFFMAGVEGRYARVDYRVCLDCGTWGERAILSFPITMVGCLLVVVALTLLFMGGALARLPTWVLPMLGIGSWLVLTWVASRAVRLGFRARQAGLPAGNRCASCGGTRLRDIASALRESVPCPSCKNRSFRLHAVDLVPGSDSVSPP